MTLEAFGRDVMRRRAALGEDINYGHNYNYGDSLLNPSNCHRTPLTALIPPIIRPLRPVETGRIAGSSV
jgi:hypothetical protein